MNQLVIIGGQVHVTPLLNDFLRQERFDRVIAADSGLEWARRLSICPDLMLGDFDSVSPETLQYFRAQSIPERQYEARKDFTDSELALWAALDEAGPGDTLWMLGGIGSRLDHTLANVFLLYEPLKRGVRAGMLDGHNEVRLIQGPASLELIRREAQPYVSLLPFLGEASGIDLEGMAYPLQDYTLRPGKSIGISNEVSGERATIRLRQGYLLVMRSCDTN